MTRINGAGRPELIEPSAAFAVDLPRLQPYLERHVEGFAGPIRLRQFQGGRSNPTYRLDTPSGLFVLRRKPPGALLASAHAVDREYEVQSKLRTTLVPVPAMRCYCADPEIIGQPFYVMDHVEGRVFPDRLLPGCSPSERADMYADLTATLAKLHQIDFHLIGLEGFGRPTDFVRRQIARWERQYEQSKVVDLPEMFELASRLKARAPPPDEAALTHGDFRIGNVVFHPEEPRIVAVLDWELSTLGHPLADLAYTCLAYHLPFLSGRGFGDADLDALGIPSEILVKSAYARAAGRLRIDDWSYFLALSLFRTAAILVGVHRRSLEGNASDARGVDAALYGPIAAAGLRVLETAI